MDLHHDDDCDGEEDEKGVRTIDFRNGNESHRFIFITVAIINMIVRGGRGEGVYQNGYD